MVCCCRLTYFCNGRRRGGLLAPVALSKISGMSSLSILTLVICLRNVEFLMNLGVTPSDDKVDLMLYSPLLTRLRVTL